MWTTMLNAQAGASWTTTCDMQTSMATSPCRRRSNRERLAAWVDMNQRQGCGDRESSALRFA